MRTTTRSGRMCLVAGGGVIDVERASAGRFSADPLAVFERWAEFVAWARAAPDGPAAPPEPAGSPSPTPRQVFAIGLNYRDHAGEAGMGASGVAGHVHQVRHLHHGPLPGDLIFTGTPAGVGHVRTPRRYLRPGDRVVTRIEGIGQLRQTCVAAA